MIVLTIVIGATVCVLGYCFFRYKEKELEYKKHDSEYSERIIKDRITLEVEQERTKQYQMQREKENEETKQLEIKANYKKEYGSNLY